MPEEPAPTGGPSRPRSPRTATSSRSVPTSSPAPCSRPTGRACSRWASTTLPDGASRLVVPRVARRASPGRAAADAVAAPVGAPLRDPDRHRLRGGRPRLRRPVQRSGGWIDPGIVAAYAELHRLGWAHSVEAWHDGRLVGGLYGVAIGGLFAGESMFTRERDASKVALVALIDLLARRVRRPAATRHPVADVAPGFPGRGRGDARGVHVRSDAALEVPLPAAFGVSAQTTSGSLGVPHEAATGRDPLDQAAGEVDRVEAVLLEVGGHLGRPAPDRAHDEQLAVLRQLLGAGRDLPHRHVHRAVDAAVGPLDDSRTSRTVTSSGIGSGTWATSTCGHTVLAWAHGGHVT